MHQGALQVCGRAERQPPPSRRWMVRQYWTSYTFFWTCILLVQCSLTAFTALVLPEAPPPRILYSVFIIVWPLREESCYVCVLRLRQGAGPRAQVIPETLPMRMRKKWDWSQVRPRPAGVPRQAAPRSQERHARQAEGAKPRARRQECEGESVKVRV